MSVGLNSNFYKERDHSLQPQLQSIAHNPLNDGDEDFERKNSKTDKKK